MGREEEGKQGAGEEICRCKILKGAGSEGEAKKRRHWSREGRKQGKPWPGGEGRKEEHLWDAGKNLCKQREHSSELQMSGRAVRSHVCVLSSLHILTRLPFNPLLRRFYANVL